MAVEISMMKGRELGRKAKDRAKEFIVICLIALAVFTLGLFTASSSLFAVFAGLIIFFGFLRTAGVLGD